MLIPTPDFPVTWVCRTLPHSVPAITEMLPDQSYLIVVNEDLNEAAREAVLKEQIEIINSRKLYQKDIIAVQEPD